LCLPIMIIVLNMTRILILIIWCGTKGDHFSFKWEIFCSNHFSISIFVLDGFHLRKKDSCSWKMVVFFDIVFSKEIMVVLLENWLFFLEFFFCLRQVCWITLGMCSLGKWLCSSREHGFIPKAKKFNGIDALNHP
jgi:hypothetical protein